MRIAFFRPLRGIDFVLLKFIFEGLNPFQKSTSNTGRRRMTSQTFYPVIGKEVSRMVHPELFPSVKGHDHIQSEKRICQSFLSRPPCR
jgi:hypothetical protein